MADDQYVTLWCSDILKSGWAKTKSKTFGRLKKRWLVLHGSSSQGPVRLVKYESEEALKRGELLSVAELSIIKSAKMDSSRTGFLVELKSNKIKQFICTLEAEAYDWVKVINSQLQAPSSSEDMFHVSLMPNPLLNISGECVMLITNGTVHLLPKDQQTGHTVNWPLTVIRKFWMEEVKYKGINIETGRAAEKGEGLFLFKTVYYKEVYQALNTASRQVHRESIGSGRFSSGSSIGSTSNAYIPGGQSDSLPGDRRRSQFSSEGSQGSHQGRSFESDEVFTQQPPPPPHSVTCGYITPVHDPT